MTKWHCRDCDEPNEMQTLERGERGRLRLIMGLRGLVLVASAAVLTACAGNPPLGGDASLNVLPGNELPAPGRSDVQSNATLYYVGPFDRLIIDVFGIEELRRVDI